MVLSQSVWSSHVSLRQYYIRFGSKSYRQILCIPMYTHCAPLVADLFMFSYETDFMLSLSDDNQLTLLKLSILRGCIKNTLTFVITLKLLDVNR